MFRFLPAFFFAFVISSFLWLDEMHDWVWERPVYNTASASRAPSRLPSGSQEFPLSAPVYPFPDWRVEDNNPEATRTRLDADIAKSEAIPSTGPDEREAEDNLGLKHEVDQLTSLALDAVAPIASGDLTIPMTRKDSSLSAQDATFAPTEEDRSSPDVQMPNSTPAPETETSGVGADSKSENVLADTNSPEVARVTGSFTDQMPIAASQFVVGGRPARVLADLPPGAPEISGEESASLPAVIRMAGHGAGNSFDICEVANRKFAFTNGDCREPSRELVAQASVGIPSLLAHYPMPFSGSAGGASISQITSSLSHLTASAENSAPDLTNSAPYGSTSPNAKSDVLQSPDASHVVTTSTGESPTVFAQAAPGPSVANPTVRGVSEKEIRFGMVAPFSGSAKELGRQMKLGIESAFNLVNQTGGVHGRLIKLFSADDGYEPSRTGEAMKQLWDTDGVFGIVGNVGTPTAAVALPFALEHHLLFFGAFTGANLLRLIPPDHFVFNYRASYVEETEAAVHYLVKVRGLQPREIAVFAQQDSFGDAGFEGVAKAIRSLRSGYTETILRLNYKRNTIDVAEAVSQLRLHKPAIKAVVMVATYRAAASFIEKTRDRYPKMVYTNVSFVGSTALAEELKLQGSRFAEGVIVTQVVPAVNGYSRAILDYRAALAKFAPGEAPDYVSLEGYIVGKLLIEGLKRAGPRLDTEELINTLEDIHDLDMGLGTLINFGPSEHQASHKVWGTQLDGQGTFKPLDLE